MQIYIATGLANMARHNELRDRLTPLGITLTYDWTLAGGPAWPKGKAFITEVAENEVNGVLDADVVVVIWPGGRGTHAELGMALASDIPVMLIGDDPSLTQAVAETVAFYHHPLVSVVPNFDEAVRLFSNWQELEAHENTFADLDAPPPFQVRMIFDGEHTTGWVLTVGLALLGLPELEMRDVRPLFLMEDAARTLVAAGKYMLGGDGVHLDLAKAREIMSSEELKKIVTIDAMGRASFNGNPIFLPDPTRIPTAGQTMRFGDRVVLLEAKPPIVGEEDHYKTTRLCLVDDPRALVCDECGEAGPHAHASVVTDAPLTTGDDNGR